MQCNAMQYNTIQKLCLDGQRTNPVADKAKKKMSLYSVSFLNALLLSQVAKA